MSLLWTFAGTAVTSYCNFHLLIKDWVKISIQETTLSYLFFAEGSAISLIKITLKGKR